jgi:quercetin dioxygenase-like cupin family protein
MYGGDATIPTLTTRSQAHLTMFGVATAALLVAAVGFHAADRHDVMSASVPAVSGAVTPTGAGARPRPVAQPVSSDALPHVQGKRITTMVVEFPPDGFSPPHHHGGSVTVYVLAGVIRSQLQGQPPIVYRAGESFFEPPGAVHLLAENMSATEPARILAVFVADEGATLTTYH